MLNRVATTPTWAPVRWGNWRGKLLDGPASMLIRYALGLVILCLAGSLYFLQSNALARLNEETLRLEQQAAQLERQNMALKLQLAQWNSPAYVRGEALKRGYTEDPRILYVDVTPAHDTTAAAPQEVTQTAQTK